MTRTGLHYDVVKGRGPYLLLLHGFLSSRRQWLANLSGMAEFCSPVCVDLWGHGRSPSPDLPAFYGPAGYIAAFEEIRADLGVERWALCGASFGAGLTLQYALACPERVTAQVFTNSMSALATVAGAGGDPEERALAIETGGRAAIAEMPFHPRFAKRLDPAVAAALAEDAALLSPKGVANCMRYAGPHLSVRDRFHETRVPTLLVNGTWERAFQPVRDWAAGALPSLQVADLDGGHSINAEAPAAFNEAVRRLLTDQPASSG